ncbi:hypothetical protein GCM10012275_30270 [Longimycelium tulufanense]|uniref:Uncharacterized protein n=1 Tax=Longimycelium tulufanense TaxID=907463 RepID=A0A8J3FUQ5_9PSEU|nr:hypothetical protein [Longimycelium tulufanense]GGM57090.1 hypothetical protein GCM10012275_30270 [Longimycelium tulufanense]
MAPLRWLFDLLRGPVATPRRPGTWWRGLLVCAIDGTALTVPDTPRMLTLFTTQRGNHSGTCHHQILLVALLACGTRTLIDAVSARTVSTPRHGLVMRSLTMPCLRSSSNSS